MNQNDKDKIGYENNVSKATVYIYRTDRCVSDKLLGLGLGLGSELRVRVRVIYIFNRPLRQ
jgi:hypothetical protein